MFTMSDGMLISSDMANVFWASTATPKALLSRLINDLPTILDYNINCRITMDSST